MVSFSIETNPIKCSYQVVFTVANEHQPIRVQVVKWVGLVANGFQFLRHLAAVFAEEVNGCCVVELDGPI